MKPRSSTQEHNMQIAVTGAAGFLGSHVADVLQTKGHKVKRLDKKADSASGIVGADLLDTFALKKAIEGCDAICHLAAIGDVYHAFENPALASATNVTGSANLLEVALDNGIEKFIYASTWEVYGKPVYQPVDEKHPCCPDHPYNITKLAGEQLAMSYDHLKGLNVLVLRIGTTYGSRMRPNSVFSIFIRSARNKDPIVIKGTGEQTRQFVHEKDVGYAFYAALRSSAHYDVFNIAGNQNISIKQLAEMVCEKLPTEICFESTRVGDITPAILSSAKAQRELNWDPKVDFRSGLFAMIEEEDI